MINISTNFYFKLAVSITVGIVTLSYTHLFSCPLTTTLNTVDRFPGYKEEVFNFLVMFKNFSLNGSAREPFIYVWASLTVAMICVVAPLCGNLSRAELPIFCVPFTIIYTYLFYSFCLYFFFLYIVLVYSFGSFI